MEVETVEEPPVNEPPVETVDSSQDSPSPKPSSQPPLRRSTRLKKPPDRFTFDKQHGYSLRQTYSRIIAKKLRSRRGRARDILCYLNMAFDPKTGLFEEMDPPEFHLVPHLLKAKTTRYE